MPDSHFFALSGLRFDPGQDKRFLVEHFSLGLGGLVDPYGWFSMQGFAVLGWKIVDLLDIIKKKYYIKHGTFKFLAEKMLVS